MLRDNRFCKKNERTVMDFTQILRAISNSPGKVKLLCTLMEKRDVLTNIVSFKHLDNSNKRLMKKWYTDFKDKGIVTRVKPMVYMLNPTIFIIENDDLIKLWEAIHNND